MNRYRYFILLFARYTDNEDWVKVIRDKNITFERFPLELSKNGKWIKRGTFNSNINNQIIYLLWLFIKLGYKNIEDLYNINIQILRKNYGDSLLKYHKNSLFLILKNIFTKKTITGEDWLEWKMNQTPHGFWDDINNQKKYFDYYIKQKGFKDIHEFNKQDFYDISKDDISDNYGRSLLEHHKNSPFLVLTELYPDMDWYEWKMKVSPMGFWFKNNKFQVVNIKKFMQWIFDEKKYTNLDDWYKIDGYDVSKYINREVLSHYKSLFNLLKIIYPEKKTITGEDWLEWKMKVSPMGFWNDINNQKKFFEYYIKQRGFKDIHEFDKNDFYDISKDDIIKNDGGRLLQLYTGGFIEILRKLYPDIDWYEWKLKITPDGFWKEIKNVRNFMDWYYKEKKFNNLDDLYNISSDDIKKYASGLYKDYNSLFKIFQDSYPEKKEITGEDWLEWKMNQTSPRFWDDINNQKRYMNWLFGVLKYTNLEDWYKVSIRIIKDNYGTSLLKKYRYFYELFSTIYPNIEWNKKKFIKSYSQGELEFIMFMRVSFPNIISLATTETQYCIDGTRKYADGYDEESRIIFEYLGDYWHGNPKIYTNPNEIHPVIKITYRELYEKELERQKICEEKGYIYITVWESDWERGKKALKQLQRKFKKIKNSSLQV